MTKYLVFGHKNPDTDAVSAAIAMSYFLEKLGEEAEPVALGEMNDETSFALNYFNVNTPRIITSVANETEKVALVDHNEPIQSVDDIADVQIDYVVDHHRISGFETAQPLFYRAEPIGSTSTILYKMFNEYDFDIPQSIAGLMLSAIISDTLLFKSPTCTNQDKSAAYELAKMADVSIDEYGLELLKSGTKLAGKTETELINSDAKNFEMNGRQVRIGQINVIGFEDMLERKDAILGQMNKELAENNYDLSLFVITDVLESTSIGFVAGTEDMFVEKAFNQSIVNKQIELKGVVSRKKQVVPQITEAFEN